MMNLLLLVAASVTCPALDTATVAGAIGEVQVAVTRPEKGAGYTCLFTRADYELKLEISELAAADQFRHLVDDSCQGGRDVTPVKAIGNEAVICSLGNDSHIAEKLVSRVRNQAFVIFLNTTDRSADVKSIRAKSRMLAEQVAGNLF